MGDLTDKLRKGARLLAAAGAYVPAVHCSTAPQPSESAVAPTPVVAAAETPAEVAPEPAPEPTAEPVAAPPVSAEASEPAVPVELPPRPGAGSRAECSFVEQVGVILASGAAATREDRVRQTYARFSASLGGEYQGEMDDGVGWRQEGSRTVVTVGYGPTTEPWRSRYDRVEISFLFPLAAEVGARGGEARSSARGRLRLDGTDEVVEPEAVCALRAQPAAPPECAYPRWNPRGMRYGLFDAITPEREG